MRLELLLLQGLAATSEASWFRLSACTCNSMARILSVSYDRSLLHTRQMLLEGENHVVVSAHGFTDSLRQCKSSGYDLFILGHSIPHTDKLELVTDFRKHNRAPVISLRMPGEPIVDSADIHIEPEPVKLLQCVAELLEPSGRS